MLHLSVNRRRFLTGAAAGAAALSLRPGLSYAVEGDTLFVRAASDIEILDPAFQNGLLEEEIGRCLFVSLNRLDDMRTGVHLRPYAARSLNQTSPTEIAFELNDWLVWTGDFGPVTAEDVKYSFERVANPANGSAWAYAFDALREVEVTGTRTGIIHLKAPSAPFPATSLPYYMGHIVCKKAVEAAGGKFTTEVPASAGPYLIDKWVPKQSVALTLNPAWKGEPPAFPRVQFQIITDDEAAALAYESRATHYSRISLNTLSIYKDKLPERTTLIQHSGNRFAWIAININNPKLADPKVRRAIQYAIDVGQIMDGSYSGLAAPATGVVPPALIGHREAILYPTDAAKSQALLAEAGVSGLSLELAAMNDKTSQLTCQIIQALLGSVGITVDIKPYDEGVYWTLGDKSAGDTWKTLDLVLMNFAGGVDPSENLTWFRPKQIGIYNWSQFDSPEFEALYNEGMAQTDPDKRGAIYRKMQDLMEESGGFVFITHETFAAVARQGLEPCILADGYVDVTRFRKD
ncbi:peptide/nickel transport system substrate-binding protein [Angulomicrobium tetraedrale]|uniref:Peptide/nickel transport system substrate-binding protein n=1 Tax=Ancylobacter tetraedralis TaxID=217068 RepID=A0A839ZBP8_9HYPH|nr:ABC transporter substrate-binding protein [Ancylobacter tetraedralis]MBB3772174.1 peptide/nickel transport system substrate-binding protein [Ancylobacter tetraedralis]